MGDWTQFDEKSITSFQVAGELCRDVYDGESIRDWAIRVDKRIHTLFDFSSSIQNKDLSSGVEYIIYMWMTICKIAQAENEDWKYYKKAYLKIRRLRDINVKTIPTDEIIGIDLPNPLRLRLISKKNREEYYGLIEQFARQGIRLLDTYAKSGIVAKYDKYKLNL